MQNILKSAKYLVALQFFSKAATFTLNQLLISRIEPSTLGIVSIQLELLYSSILNLSREAIRSSLSRIDFDKVRDKKTFNLLFAQMVNLSWISVLIGPIVYFGLRVMVINETSPALQLYAISAIIELMSEPVFISLQNFHLYHVRAIVESVAVFIKCFTTFSLIVYAYQPAVLAYSIGQVSFTLSLTLGYYTFTFVQPTLFNKRYAKSFRSWFPSRSKPLVNADHVHLSMAFASQTLIKVFLSEGDKIVSTLIASNYDQGIFALVSNYGSLVVRLVFLPLEESVRANAGKTVKDFNVFFQRITRIFIYLLIYTVIFPRFYSAFIIKILAGSKWSDAGPVLTVYAVYVGLLGINGVSEGYLHSISSRTRVFYNTLFMLVCFGFYACVSYLFYVKGFGSLGLVYANIVNVLLRIFYSLATIRLETAHKLTEIVGIPNFKTCLTFIVTFCFLSVLETMCKNEITFFSLGIVAALSNGIAIIFLDPEMKQLMRKPKKDKKI